jgi:hypothetical protein
MSMRLAWLSNSTFSSKTLPQYRNIDISKHLTLWYMPDIRTMKDVSHTSPLTEDVSSVWERGAEAAE